jgi:hypothetical protein
LNADKISDADKDSEELVAITESIIEEDTPYGAPVEENFGAMPEPIIIESQV